MSKFQVGDWVVCIPQEGMENPAPHPYGCKAVRVRDLTPKGALILDVDPEADRLGWYTQIFRAATADDLWSDWIDWRGGQCPIPWAMPNHWGSRSSSSTLYRSNVLMEVLGASSVNVDYWKRKNPTVLECNAYRFRVDMAPEGFIPPNGSFTDDDGDSHFYTLQKNISGLTLTVLDNKVLTGKHLDLAYAVDEKVNVVEFNGGNLGKDFVIQGRVRLKKDDAVIEDDSASITIPFADLRERADYTSVSDFSGHIRWLLENGKISITDARKIMGLEPIIGWAHDQKIIPRAQLKTPEAVLRADFGKDSGAGAKLGLDGLIGEARRCWRLNKSEPTMEAVFSALEVVRDAIKPTPEAPIDPVAALRAELEEVTADAEYWKGRAELYEQQLDAVRRIVAPEGDQL